MRGEWKARSRDVIRVDSLEMETKGGDLLQLFVNEGTPDRYRWMITVHGERFESMRHYPLEEAKEKAIEACMIYRLGYSLYWK